MEFMSSQRHFIAPLILFFHDLIISCHPTLFYPKFLQKKKKKKFLQEKTSGRLASVCHESTLSPAQGDISKNVTLKMEFITIILLQMNHRNL